MTLALLRLSTAMIQTPTTDTSGTPAWLGLAVALTVGLLGGGGLAALLKVRHDKKMGVAQQETVEDDALATRWQKLIEAQTTSLVRPLQERLETLEGKVTTLETELAGSRAKYWRAVAYIRVLLTWISRHVPDGTSAPLPPPDDLAQDL